MSKYAGKLPTELTRFSRGGEIRDAGTKKKSLVSRGGGGFSHCSPAGGGYHSAQAEKTRKQGKRPWILGGKRGKRGIPLRNECGKTEKKGGKKKKMQKKPWFVSFARSRSSKETLEGRVACTASGLKN